MTPAAVDSLLLVELSRAETALHAEGNLQVPPASVRHIEVTPLHFRRQSWPGVSHAVMLSGQQLDGTGQLVLFHRV
ncbi:hypothetical protein MDA_GLEAN10018170 [Myotis davidii]|uniref:Uncharacterized protein n=1 Tax=Myotis davidii TaxID=225400 RepID=L5LE30_MYODS|nr:hypothetical protein MDA_GLEAN10018170 [Myotis davidii]